LVEDLRKEVFTTRRKAVDAKTAAVTIDIAQQKLTQTQLKLSTEQAKTTSARHELGMAEDQAQSDGATRQGQQLLLAQNLRGLQLQVQEKTARNEHKGELLDLQGWGRGGGMRSAAPGGGGLSNPGGGRSPFRLNPPGGLGRMR